MTLPLLEAMRNQKLIFHLNCSPKLRHICTPTIRWKRQIISRIFSSQVAKYGMRFRQAPLRYFMLESTGLVLQPGPYTTHQYPTIAYRNIPEMTCRRCHLTIPPNT
ncbi:hypothetical protein CN09_19350 [Rhizobium rhizogenes]|nr:hypothetical protein CN09_19350 [Rhizobium rhizogenes]